MPPKTKATASVVEKYHLQLPMHCQLLYSILLETGLPVSNEAWTRIASRLPVENEKKGEPATGNAVKKRWGRLRDKWDEDNLFGEDHKELLEEAAEEKKKEAGEKKAKSKATGKGKAKGKGKGKEKVAENEDEDDSAGEGPSGCQMVDDDEGAEASESEEPVAKKARVTKAKKQTKKKAPVKTAKEEDEDGEEEDGDTEAAQMS